VVRAALENGLIARIHLARGLVAYIEANPELSTADFDAYAAALMSDDPTLRNLSVLKGTVISFVHPYLQNQAALGRDLALVDAQKAEVFQAMQTREPILSGPVSLVQGGQGLIIRIAIFPHDTDGRRYYWGQASVVIAASAIQHYADFARFPELIFALRKIDAAGNPGTVFWGSEHIFETQPIILNIDIPGGQWQLAAVPERGWNRQAWVDHLLVLVSIGLSILCGIIVFVLVQTRSVLKVMAYSDQLTKLPNRAFFWQNLKIATALAEREKHSICLCMLDLDNFKDINDNFGHAAGDKLLSDVAARLRHHLRSSDVIARLGGDEFAVLARATSKEAPTALIEKIKACFSDPFIVAGKEVTMVCSIGAAMYPEDAAEAEAVLALADQAMYANKTRA
jgi:diguanylate cyclase (GGDEF)-like protein